MIAVLMFLVGICIVLVVGGCFLEIIQNCSQKYSEWAKEQIEQLERRQKKVKEWEMENR